jgi:hypothetical protein
LLIGDNLLRRPAYLRISAKLELDFGHVDCCLVIRQHKLQEINSAIPGRFQCSHGRLHFFHTGVQFGPSGIGR